MRLRTLAWHGLKYAWRKELVVLLATLLGAAVLIGALAVGDSVRASLALRARMRCGTAELVLESREAFFGADLAQRLSSALPEAKFASLLALPGVASTPDGRARKSGIAVLGVDAKFYDFRPEPSSASTLPQAGEVWLNQRLAQDLGLSTGANLVLRVPRPSALSRDLALAQREDAVLALAVRVAGVLTAKEYGDFALNPSGLAYNAFVDREWLAERIGESGRANVVLQALAAQQELAAALEAVLRLDDADLRLREDVEWGVLELSTRRILLPSSIVRAVQASGEPALGLFTYFVNQLSAHERTTPYSTITAAGVLHELGAYAERPALAVAMDELGADELIANSWLAQDLGLSANATLELSYYSPGDAGQLVERTAQLRVKGVVPLEGAYADSTLMPDFPGIAESAHCRDWEPGIPIDLERIRDVDEAYWEEHAGTPKAWISLVAAQQLFANRFGELTAVRFPLERKQAVSAALADCIGPEEAGLQFRRLDSPAAQSGRSATDFGGLFLGLSLFLILASAILVGLGYGFAIESRARELGTLRAVGFSQGRIRALYCLEALPLCSLGALLGIPCGLLYAGGMLALLRAEWSAAIGSTSLHFAVTPLSIAIGSIAAVCIAMFATLLALAKLVRRPTLELLASRSAFLEREARALERTSSKPRLIAALALGAGGAFYWAGAKLSGPSQALQYFGAGSAFLIAGLAGARIELARRLRRGVRGHLSLSELGIRNAARRPGRSMATLVLFSSTLFLVATLALHQRGVEDATARASGTGGFALIGRTALPLHHNLESREGRELYALSEEDLRGVSLVPAIVREGEDASCLELAAPSEPALWGLEPEQLAGRQAFHFVEHEGHSSESPWLLLDEVREDGALPAIGDQAMLAWQLHKRVGDVLEYQDDAGRRFPVRIVGAIHDSVLQGSLIVSRKALQARYPRISGAKRFLVDVEGRAPSEVRTLLQEHLSEEGMELEPTASRLALLHAVQNTYLEVFQLLSALGFLLGTLGLGLVVARNALERRAEFALFLALGHPGSNMRRVLVAEHRWLFFAGTLCGLLSALAAVLPTLTQSTAGLPTYKVLSVIVLTLIVGLLSVAVAATLALSGVAASELQAER